MKEITLGWVSCCPVPLEQVPRPSRRILVKPAQARSVYLSSMSSRVRVNNGDWVCPDKRLISFVILHLLPFFCNPVILVLYRCGNVNFARRPSCNRCGRGTWFCRSLISFATLCFSSESVKFGQ